MDGLDRNTAMMNQVDRNTYMMDEADKNTRIIGDSRHPEESQAASRQPSDEFDKEANTDQTSTHVEAHDEKIPVYTYPDGGLQAWLVILGGFLAVFCSFGFINSYSVFQTYYRQHQLSDRDDSTVAWIGSFQVFLQFAGGLVSGPLFDRFGPRYLIISGSFLLVFGMMMLSLCHEYYQIFLAHGVTTGIGVALLVAPAMAVVSHWFAKRRAFAMGIVAAGSSMGGTMLPIFYSKLFATSLDFAWTVRVGAFLSLVLLIISILTIRPRLPRKPPGPFLRIQSFRERRFDLLVTAQFFLVMAQYVPIFYFQSFAMSRGVSADLAFYIISILNGASFFGRIIPGALADKFGRFNVLSGACVISTIVVFAWQAAYSLASIIIVAALFGFFSGAIISLQPPCVAEVTLDPRNIGTNFGQLLAVASIGGLIGTPVGGAIVSSPSGFTGVINYCGALFLVGTVFAVLSKIAASRKFFSII